MTFKNSMKFITSVILGTQRGSEGPPKELFGLKTSKPQRVQEVPESTSQKKLQQRNEIYSNKVNGDAFGVTNWITE